MKISFIFIISISFLFGSSIAVNISPRVFGQCVGLSLHEVYCFGGKSSNKEDATVYKDMYSMYLGNYDGQSPNQIANSWNAMKSELPIPNSDFLLIPMGYSEIMMVGGSGSVGNSSTPFIHHQYASTQAWRTGSYPNLKSAIPPLRGSAAALDGSRGGIFAGGATYGNTSSFFTDMIYVKYDYSSRITSLTTIGSINYNRIGHAMFFENNKLYIIGGQQLINNQLKSITMDQVSRFDSLLSTWTTLTYTGTIPSPRSYFTVTKAYALVRANRYIVFGGINADTNVVCTDKMYSIDYNDGKYGTLNTINAPSARFGHSAIYHNIRNFIVINGMDANGTALSDFHVYDISGNQWISNFSSSGYYGESPYEERVPRYNSQQQAACWGITVAVIFFIQLTGFGFYKYIEKKAVHHESNVNTNSLDNKESEQYHDQNNNYQPSSSPPIDNRPLPPTPIMSMPIGPQYNSSSSPIMSMPSGPQYNSSSSPIFYQQDVPYPQR